MTTENNSQKKETPKAEASCCKKKEWTVKITRKGIAKTAAAIGGVAAVGAAGYYLWKRGGKVSDVTETINPTE